MPKRGVRRKRGGSGRGGRGGGRGGGGRSLSGANRGRFPLRGNRRRSPKTVSQYGELMDDDNIYIPKTMSELASNMGRRKYGRMFEEIEYTESHQEDLMVRQLRNRPVEFVKAKEVYDPNVILYKLAKLNKKDDDDDGGIDIAVQSISLEDSEDENNESLNNGDELSLSSEESKEIEESEDEYEDEDEDWDEEELDNEISTKLQALEEAMNRVPDDSDLEESVIDRQEEQNEEVESHISVPQSSDVAEETFQESNELESKDQMESEDCTNTTPSKLTQDIETLDIIIDLPSNKVEQHLSHPHSLPQSKPPSKSNDDNNPELELESEPEYGYLEEDYEFDVSKIEVSNVRFGIENQYYIKCMELTGLNDNEYIWIDENDVIEYALDNGVKEHRLNKFLSYITKGMIDEQQPEPEPEPEVYISDTNSESEDEEEEEDDEEADDYPYDLDDNLQDLIEYSKTSTQGLIPFEDRDFSNKNIPAKKRRTFDDLDLDDELQESLIRQLQNYKTNKKNKKHQWEQQKLEESILHNDMLIKYPIHLHIKDIKYEFEQFLKDESRQSLSFPTLDTHGHKTIQKLADCYHMSVIKSGKQGIRKYLKIVKNKSTFKYYPNYEIIDKILRGRPIFHRIDQKPSHSKKNEKKSNRGNSSSSKTRFKEGDIVGAEAPEIDSSNLGRQMLEKLGWIQGQGLGIEGNKGINEPILAKVKTSKTGIK